MAERKHHPMLLRREHTGLLVIDVQERLHQVMWQKERVEENARKLIRGFQILSLPVLVTEQYPKGLGPTVESLRDLLGELRPYEKLHFSCCAVEPLMNEIERRDLFQIVLCGIETHVCVVQTALDLLHHGYQVHVPADAVSSRRKLDWYTALERMRRSGVVVTTTESVLFELHDVAGTPGFKEVAALVK